MNDTPADEFTQGKIEGIRIINEAGKRIIAGDDVQEVVKWLKTQESKGSTFSLASSVRQTIILCYRIGLQDREIQHMQDERRALLERSGAGKP